MTIKIQNATVETLEIHEARPVGKCLLRVSLCDGDHTFDLWIDDEEALKAIAEHTLLHMEHETPAQTAEARETRRLRNLHDDGSVLARIAPDTSQYWAGYNQARKESGLDFGSPLM